MLRRSIIGLIAASIAAALSPAAAHADGWVTIRYSGTYDHVFIYQPQAPAVWQDTLHFAWDERQVFHLVSPNRHTAEPVQLNISGHFQSTHAPPNSNLDCSYNVVPRPGAPSPILFSWQGGPRAGGTAMMPITGTYAADSGSTSPNCVVSPNGGVGVGSTLPDNVLAVYSDAAAADLAGVLGGPTVSKSYDAEGSTPNGQETASFHAIVSVANSARKPANTAVSPPTTRTPARTKAKLAALDAFRDTFQRALYPCGVGAGIGTALIAAGPVGAAVGGTMSALGTPLCLALLQTLKAEADTVADPPNPSYLTAATIKPVHSRPLKLPACATARGPDSPGAVCRKFEPAARTLMKATLRTGAAAVAIDTTISRETAALNAGSAKGVGLQDRTLADLAPKFAARVRAENSAARALARILRSAGLNVTLDAASGPAALTRLQSRLARTGVSRDKVTTVLGVAPTVTATDLLTAFSMTP